MKFRREQPEPGAALFRLKPVHSCLLDLFVTVNPHENFLSITGVNKVPAKGLEDFSAGETFLVIHRLSPVSGVRNVTDTNENVGPPRLDHDFRGILENSWKSVVSNDLRRIPI